MKTFLQLFRNLPNAIRMYQGHGLDEIVIVYSIITNTYFIVPCSYCGISPTGANNISKTLLYIADANQVLNRLKCPF